MALHTVLKKSLIAVKIVVMTELTAFTAVDTALWIAFQAPMRMSLQFSQMNWNGKDIMSTAGFQNRANEHHCGLHHITNGIPDRLDVLPQAGEEGF